MKIVSGTLPKIEVKKVDRRILGFPGATVDSNSDFVDALRLVRERARVPIQADLVVVETGTSVHDITWTWVETVIDSVTILSKVEPVVEGKHVRERVSTLHEEYVGAGLLIKDEVARFYRVPQNAEFEKTSAGPDFVDYRWDWYEVEFTDEE